MPRPLTKASGCYNTVESNLGIKQKFAIYCKFSLPIFSECGNVLLLCTYDCFVCSRHEQVNSRCLSGVASCGQGNILLGGLDKTECY